MKSAVMEHLVDPLVDEALTFDTPLVFNKTIDASNVKNLLLIDSLVYESQLFYDSANSTTFPVIYSCESNVDDFKNLLDTKLNNIDRISFVFHDNILNGKTFINGQLLFTDLDLVDNASSFSQNTQLLIDTIKKLGVKNVDFLACNSLNYPNWVKFYALLNKQTNVIVGASNNKTGNLKYGGDWIMENTNENVVNTYFTSNIKNYASSLTSTISQSGGIIYIKQTGSDIQYQSNSTSGVWTNVTSWPVTIVNNTPAAETILTISFFTDITLNSASQYFITGSNFITYDGTGKIVTINSVAGYLGLIQNGTSIINGKHGVKVQNIISDLSNNSTLNGNTFTRAGWICQAYFGLNIDTIPDRVPILIDNCINRARISNNISGGSGNGGIVGGRSFINGLGNISNCSNSGNIIPFFAGGIIGSGLTGQKFTCTNSSNTGAISGQGAGGISGLSSGQGGSATIINCSNTGAISGQNAGGICAQQAGIFNGSATITNSSNAGAISGQGAGGICGLYAGYIGSVTITNCSNAGAISGSSAGGICAQQAGQIGSATITNCSNAGEISAAYSGGICGAFAGFTDGIATLTNCSNTGIISGSYSGGITGDWFGYNSNKLCSISKCYNIGNIAGAYSGGICGSEVGYSGNVSYTANILISECYSLGDIATNSGGILGGTEGSVYSNTPIVNITNCYTAYNSIADANSQYVATNLQIPTTQTNVYTQFINSWSDSAAKSALTNAPTSVYVSNPAATWTTTQANTPYVLSDFSANIYNPNMVTNPDGNYKSSAGLFTPNYNYKLISVNDNLAPDTITIDESSGVLSFDTFYFNKNSAFIEKVFTSKGSSPYYYGYNFNKFTLNQVLCFKEGSKILYFNSETNVEEYIEIEKLRKGNLVKTFLNGYKPITHIGYSKMYNQVNEVRSKGKLYKCCKTEFPEVFEDLVITGCHSILVKEFKESERDETKEILGEIYVTERHYRLPACVDKRTHIYEEEGLHNVWHFSLEHDNYYMNYGVYANGLLVETTSNRMMKELSGANLIE